MSRKSVFVELTGAEICNLSSLIFVIANNGYPIHRPLPLPRFSPRDRNRLVQLFEPFLSYEIALAGSALPWSVEDRARAMRTTLPIRLTDRNVSLLGAVCRAYLQAFPTDDDVPAPVRGVVRADVVIGLTRTLSSLKADVAGRSHR